MTFKQFRDAWLLLLGSIGFLSQVVIYFYGGGPNFLLMAASLTLLGAPLMLYADERGYRDRKSEVGTHKDAS